MTELHRTVYQTTQHHTTPLPHTISHSTMIAGFFSFSAYLQDQMISLLLIIGTIDAIKYFTYMNDYVSYYCDHICNENICHKWMIIYHIVDLHGILIWLLWKNQMMKQCNEDLQYSHFRLITVFSSIKEDSLYINSSKQSHIDKRHRSQFHQAVSSSQAE